MEGEKTVRIHGEERTVNATVERIHGFSAHGDKNELLRWMSGIQPPPRRVFVTHGEQKSALAFADFIREQRDWTVSVPEYGEKAELD